MKTRMYWASQHVRLAIHEIRHSFNCWCLGQRVEFLEWRLALDALAPQSHSVPASFEYPHFPHHDLFADPVLSMAMSR